LFILPKNFILYYLGCKNQYKSESVDSLCSKGYYLYNEQLNLEEIINLKNTYLDLLSKTEVSSNGQANGRIMMPHLNSEIVNNYIEKFTPVAINFFNNKSIEVELSMFQKSKVETEIDNIPGGGYHVDDNKKNLKFFIYLTDVTEKNGPFMLSPNSQGFSFRKFIRFMQIEITAKRKYYYIDKLYKGLNPPIKILGKAGTIFCGDTTLYHKADRVIEGERLVLVISFAENRFNPYKYLLKKQEKSTY
jgi:hypothetical protein